MTKRRKSWLIAAGILLVTGFSLCLFLCNKQQTAYRVETIKTNSGWGYVIYKNQKAFIYQEYIPGISGNIGFADEKTAFQAGRMVMKKLKAGKNPALSRQEINRLLDK